MKHVTHKMMLSAVLAAVLIVTTKTQAGLQYTGAEENQMGGLCYSVPEHVREKLFSDVVNSSETKIQTVGSGITALMAVLTGFFCVTLVRDQRAWKAILYLLLINPVMAEGQCLKHFVELQRFTKTAERNVQKKDSFLNYIAIRQQQYRSTINTVRSLSACVHKEPFSWLSSKFHWAMEVLQYHLPLQPVSSSILARSPPYAL